MKAEREEYGRRIELSEIKVPEDGKLAGLPTELGILVQYVGPGDIHKAVLLDTVVMPAIIQAINQRAGTLALLREALDNLLRCNPQDPKLIYSGKERCPADHPNRCGSCDLYHRIQAQLKEAGVCSES